MRLTIIGESCKGRDRDRANGALCRVVCMCACREEKGGGLDEIAFVPRKVLA